MQETQEIINTLNSIGVQLNGVENYLWPMLVKSAFTSAIIWVSVSFLLLITIICFTWRAIKKQGNSEDKYYDSEGATFVFLPILLMCGIALLFFMSDGINNIINPEIKALENIIKISKE